MILGTGIDLVFLPSFEEQLQIPGSTFLQSFLTPHELRTVLRKSSNDEGVADIKKADINVSIPALARHAGTRWAAKEAVVKAWSAALMGYEPPITAETLDWQEIEVQSDHWNRPSIALHGKVRSEIAHSLHTDFSLLKLHVSLSQEGEYATGLVILEKQTTS